MPRRGRAASRLAAAALVVGCALGANTTSPPPPTTETLRWLAGDWLRVDGHHSSRETWTILNRRRMVGTSRQLKRGRTVFREDLEIVAENGTLLYRADPQGQPPHTFGLAARGENWVRFEDPTHDWPQTIEYRRRGRELTAVVSGEDNGALRTSTFTWVQVESPSE